MMPKRSPSNLELEILKVLWTAESRGDLPMGVRDVRLALAADGRTLSHSSVITTLNIMVGKKFVKRTKFKNALRFSPTAKRHEVCQQEVTNLLDRVFEGSAESLMSALLDTDRINSDDIAEIKRLINRKARQGEI